jgi:WD40 repeat protein
MRPLHLPIRFALPAVLAASGSPCAAALGPPDIAWVGKGDSVSSLSVSPDGQTIVTGNLFGLRLKMWRIDGTYVRTFGDVYTEYWSTAFSPDGRYLVAGRHAAVGGEQATALIYRTSDGALIRGLNAGPEHDFGFVPAVDYSPAGDLVAVCYNEYISGIELYNPLTGALIRSLPEGGYSARFSPDGQTIAGTRQGGPRLWRVSDGAVLHTFPGGGTLFSFSSDGQILAIGQNPFDPTVRLFRTTDGGLVRTIVPATVQYVKSIKFSPVDDLLVIAGYRDAATPVTGHLSDHTIDAYHMDGSLAWSYYHAYGIAFEVGFTPDGRTLMVGGGWDTPPNYVEGGTDAILRLNAATGAEVAHFAGRRGYSNRVAFSPDNRLFASAGGIVMQVWNVADGTVNHTFEHGAGSVEFSRDGTKLVANVGNIGVWSVPGYTLLHVLPGHNNGTTDAVFTPDGSMVASGGFDNRVKLRRIVDGSVVWNQPVNAPPLTLAAAPDGGVIAAGTRGSTVYLWRASDGALLRTIPGVNVVESIAFSPDSSMLAVAENAYFDNLKLYRVSDGALLRAFHGSIGFQKNSVAFTPDGATLVFSAGGQYLQLWRIADGALLREYDEETGTGPYNQLPVAVSPDGRYFGYGREDHMVVMARNPFGRACSADVNGDGSVNLSDFLEYLRLYAAGDPRADTDADGSITVADFLAFISRYAEGC